MLANDHSLAKCGHSLANYGNILATYGYILAKSKGRLKGTMIIFPKISPKFIHSLLGNDKELGFKIDNKKIIKELRNSTEERKRYSL